jgi:hypothetical protein
MIENGLRRRQRAMWSDETHTRGEAGKPGLLGAIERPSQKSSESRV